MIVLIENIHVHNDHLIDDIAGIAGYCRAWRYVDQITATLDLMSPEFRKMAGTKDEKIIEMLSEFVDAGFRISLKP